VGPPPGGCAIRSSVWRPSSALRAYSAASSIILASRPASTMRMAQRGIRMKEADFIVQYGTAVDNGYLFRDEDCLELESEARLLLEYSRRLRGKRFVVADGRIITAYRATKKERSRLLRKAYERDLND
jgi:hypothetical protein